MSNSNQDDIGMRNIESNVEMGSVEMEDKNENHEMNNRDLVMGDGKMEDEMGDDDSEVVDDIEMTEVDIDVEMTEAGVDVEMAEVEVGVN